MIYSQFGISPVSSIERRWQSAGDSLAKLSELAINPAGWFRQQRMMMENGRASLRAAMPLPKLQGSVDALRASVLSAMIAAGLEYRPRFTVQEYTTYTQALIAKNRESWFGPRSPDHILFGLEPIDRRYPALSEGSLWPDLLRFYEPTQRITNNLVVLSRRRQPLPEILGAPITSTVRLGEGFAIGPDPTFVTLDIRLNWLGRLLSFLLKPPIVHLKFEYARGASGPDDYRVIPTIAREGFIISPRVDTADGYVDLAIGDKTAFGPSRSPVAARIIVDPIGSWAYDGSVNVTLRQIDTTILEHYRPDMSNW
jgi:hypothetical protein